MSRMSVDGKPTASWVACVSVDGTIYVRDLRIETYDRLECLMSLAMPDDGGHHPDEISNVHAMTVGKITCVSCGFRGMFVEINAVKQGA